MNYELQSILTSDAGLWLLVSLIVCILLVVIVAFVKAGNEVA